MDIIRNSAIDKTAKTFRAVKTVNSFVGAYCTIGDYSNLNKSRIEDHVEINRNCTLDKREMGLGSYINQNTILKNVIVKKFCCISWNVCLYGGSSHNFHTPSMYTSFHWKKMFGSTIEYSNNEKSKTVIGNDVWIGNGAIVINGVSVGDGGVIGAGAVVTKDVPPYSVVVGYLQKLLRKDFQMM